MKAQMGKFKSTIIILWFLFVTASSGVIHQKYVDGPVSITEKDTHRKMVKAEQVISKQELLPIGVLPIFFGTIEASLSGK